MSSAALTDFDSEPTKVKPRFRGVSHQIAFFVAMAGSLALFLVSAGTRLGLGAGIYGVTLMTLFGISALYHRPMWGARGRAIMKRLDHASIFVFIAGCYTPIALLALPSEQARSLLWFAWGFAGAGALHSIFLVHIFRKFNALLFVIMGCSMVPFSGELLAGMGPGCMALLVGGGAIYILGAVVYARRWPNPRPTIFGYHEVFHLMVIAGVVLHYAAVMTMLVRVV